MALLDPGVPAIDSGVIPKVGSLVPNILKTAVNATPNVQLLVYTVPEKIETWSSS